MTAIILTAIVFFTLGAVAAATWQAGYFGRYLGRLHNEMDKAATEYHEKCQKVLESREAQLAIAAEHIKGLKDRLGKALNAP